MTGVGRSRVVAVIGAADASPEEAMVAERVGQLLAERGAIVACGGRGGVMEAVCRGSAARGGVTVGILPGSDPGEGNAFLTIGLPTGMGQARNAILVLAGEAVIAIGGGAGTLSEIGLALKAGKRVVGLGTWDARDCHGVPAEILQASSPEQAVALAIESGSVDPRGGT
jgi:uncharacterized protein (TIGR00725 family)